MSTENVLCTGFPCINDSLLRMYGMESQIQYTFTMLLPVHNSDIIDLHRNYAYTLRDSPVKALK